VKLALTFDDGPSQWTEPLLDVLARHGALATFFVLGANIAGHEGALKRAAASGHAIGNHSYDHLELARCDIDEARRQIDETTLAIEAVVGYAPELFRAPYDRPGEHARGLAESRGLAYVSFDVEPGDWKPGVSAEQIVQHVLRHAHDGAIVDLHDGRPAGDSSARRDCTPTVDAVEQLAPALRERGYELVTVLALSA
jgi:peptidoglycan/xylan/chitin deacetylase (PgdA/CDA1 family)